MLLQTPDLILYNAKVYTVDVVRPWAEAVAIASAWIVAVGSTAEIRRLATRSTHQVDLGGRLVLPGLCDAHIHLYDYALMRQRVPLAETRSKTAMLAQLDQATKTAAPGTWLIGQGWNESRWGTVDFPTAADLDAVTGEIPVLCYRSDMHIAVANSAALQQAGITAATPDPANGIIDRDATGAPTGILHELAIGLVTQQLPLPTQQQVAAGITGATHQLHQLGITAIHDQRMKDGREGPQMLAAYSALREVEELSLRVNSNIAAHQLPLLAELGLRSGLGDDYLRLGHVKVFADGSLGSRTAWMLTPFVQQTPHEPANSGIYVTPPEQMMAAFRQAIALGFPISVHAIGDRANRVVLDIFEELAPLSRNLSVPHRIEHVQTIDPTDLPRLARLGITASVQPLHITDDRNLADLYLGERGRNTYPFQSLRRAGTRLAFGSDAPVADANPFVGMHAAMMRRQAGSRDVGWYPHEGVSLQEALYAYTLGAAAATGWERAIGTITPGKRADIIVLDRNLFDLTRSHATVDEIAATQVEATLFDGKTVHTIPESALHEQL